MITELTLPESQSALAKAGEAANRVAARTVFRDYRERKAENTIRRQDAGLALFAEYLQQAGVEAQGEALATDATAWAGVTWGLVEGFKRWQLHQGYAVGSVNVRLSTVKRYAQLAMQAGTLAPEVYAMIKTVQGYSRKEAKRIDEQREDAGLETRVGAKAPDPVSLTATDVRRLKDQPDTPQGRRDRLLMCLLLDHGLRVGEVAGLTVSTLDLEAGELRFYREKVDKVQTHRLASGTLAAARDYLGRDAPALGPLLKSSRKGGALTHVGLSVRAITDRVCVLGKRIGVEGLSAHDCRHAWATRAARNKTDPFALQEAGGWSSLAMPRRYVETAKIANEGVILNEDNQGG